LRSGSPGRRAFEHDLEGGMPGRRKRRRTDPKTTRSSTPKGLKNGEKTPEERKCWLCLQPLRSETVNSLFGRDVFEVHQRCYEQAMKM
jgi:hypothetical protein